MKLTDKEYLEAVKYAEKSDKKKSNFVELLQTTLKQEIKMSFGYMLGSVAGLIIVSAAVCILAFLVSL